jgi:flagellar hook-length control protein FliK
LVTNVQQTVTDSKGSAPATTNDAIAGVSLVDGTAALAAQAQAAQVVASAAGNAADTASNAPASGDSAQSTASALKNLAIAEPTSAATSATTAVDGTNTALQTDKQSVSALQAATSAASSLDLAATAEKNIQAGLAALDTNALKIEQAAQTTPAATALTQQAIASTQALPINPGETLTPQVGRSGWDQAVGQKVVWMVAGGQQSASLTLNPPDLGPMQVVLNVTNSHASVTFSAAQPEVRQALEAALPRLREMLGDAGIQLGQASINSGSAQQQNASAQQGSGSSARPGNTVSASETAISTTGTMSTSAGLGLVDTFA